MIHGLQNNKAGAVSKFKIAKRRLKTLGYRYPVIGYSYDANTKGAHLQKTQFRAIRIGQKIAKKNGRNLSQFQILHPGYQLHKDKRYFKSIINYQN